VRPWLTVPTRSRAFSMGRLTSTKSQSSGFTNCNSLSVLLLRRSRCRAACGSGGHGERRRVMSSIASGASIVACGLSPCRKSVDVSVEAPPMSSTETCAQERFIPIDRPCRIDGRDLLLSPFDTSFGLFLPVAA